MRIIFKLILVLFVTLSLSLMGCFNSSSSSNTTTKKTLHVYFNANNGTGTMAEETIVEGSDFTISANTFTRSGYCFHGWNTKADGSGTSYADEATIINVSSDITLYAVWDLQLHIYFNANYGTGTMAEQIVVQGADFTIPANAFCRYPYSFLHWNTHANNSGVNYADGAVIQNVSTDITLYAIWELLPHVIKYIDFDEGLSLSEIFETVEDPDNTLSIQSDITMSGSALKKNLGSTHRLDVPFNGTTSYRDFWVMYDFYVESTDFFDAGSVMPLILLCDSTRVDGNGINKLIGTPLYNRYDGEPLEAGFKYIRPVTNILSTNESNLNSFEKICVRVPEYSYPIYETFQMMNRWHIVKLHIKMDNNLAGLDMYIDKEPMLQTITLGDEPEPIDFNLLRIWDHDYIQNTPNSNIYIDNIGLYTDDPDV